MKFCFYLVALFPLILALEREGKTDPQIETVKKRLKNNDGTIIMGCSSNSLYKYLLWCSTCNLLDEIYQVLVFRQVPSYRRS